MISDDDDSDGGKPSSTSHIGMRDKDLLPQNLLHRFSFCELINQLV